MLLQQELVKMLLLNMTAHLGQQEIILLTQDMVLQVLDHKLQRLVLVVTIEQMLHHLIQTVQELETILLNTMELIGLQEIIILSLYQQPDHVDRKQRQLVEAEVIELTVVVLIQVALTMELIGLLYQT